MPVPAILSTCGSRKNDPIVIRGSAHPESLSTTLSPTLSTNTQQPSCVHFALCINRLQYLAKQMHGSGLQKIVEYSNVIRHAGREICHPKSFQRHSTSLPSTLGIATAPTNLHRRGCSHRLRHGFHWPGARFTAAR
jgi:hypothetical protein